MRVIFFAFGRGCAAAGLTSKVVFIEIRMPLRQKPCDVHSRDCRCDIIDGRIALAAAIQNQSPRWDVERVQQSTERFPVGIKYVGSKVGDFKLGNRQTLALSREKTGAGLEPGEPNDFFSLRQNDWAPVH